MKVDFAASRGDADRKWIEPLYLRLLSPCSRRSQSDDFPAWFGYEGPMGGRYEAAAENVSGEYDCDLEGDEGATIERRRRIRLTAAAY
jgi:hypothetical protein